jgi:rhamnosyltransferase
MMYKVGAYITAYEDEDAVLRCINALKQQSYSIQEIFIVDNSLTPLKSLTLFQDPKITVESYSENIGIAEGLRKGIQRAIRQEFDFLWTFDQDSEPLPDTLEKLVHYYDLLTTNGMNLGVIGSLPVDCITGQVWHGIVFDKYRFVVAPNCEDSNDFYKCDAVITSGSLINLEVAKQVPLPEEGFFIDAVDWEYCMKFKKHGYDIFVVKSSILKHRFGNSRSARAIFRKRDVTIYNYSPLRYYYMCRNHTFVETRLAGEEKQIPRSVLRRLEFLVIMLVKIAFYEKSSMWLKVWACLRGTYDGFIGRLGKTW